jgi:hypothetical protein
MADEKQPHTSHIAWGNIDQVKWVKSISFGNLATISDEAEHYWTAYVVASVAFSTQLACSLLESQNEFCFHDFPDHDVIIKKLHGCSLMTRTATIPADLRGEHRVLLID